MKNFICKHVSQHVIHQLSHYHVVGCGIIKTDAAQGVESESA